MKNLDALVKAAKDGDRSAASDLLVSLRAPINSMARRAQIRFNYRIHEESDIAQQIALEILDNISSFDPPYEENRLWRWAYGIGSRVSVDMMLADRAVRVPTTVHYMMKHRSKLKEMRNEEPTYDEILESGPKRTCSKEAYDAARRALSLTESLDNFGIMPDIEVDSRRGMPHTKSHESDVIERVYLEQATEMVCDELTDEELGYFQLLVQKGSYEQASRELEISASTLWRRIMRARSRVRSVRVVWDAD